MPRRKAVFALLALLLDANVYGVEDGQMAPLCALTSLDGIRVPDTHHYRGKVLYVDFWASWCGPCVQSFPFVNDLDRDLQAKGLQVLAVNLDENPDDAKTFLAQHPASFPVVADASGQCPLDFGVQAMPSSYLVDRRGVIRHIHLGFRAGEAAQLRSQVEQLLAEPPDAH